MTIIQAAIKVLQNYTDGLSSDKIYEIILENSYFDFGAQDPKHVLENALKRHCEGTKMSQSSSNICLTREMQGNNYIYKLKYIKGQIMGESKNIKYISATISDIQIYTFIMTVEDLANISYVAVRGKDEEIGAVQRVLNRQRISSIKNYVLNGNMFVNTFVLNWTNADMLPVINDDYIEIPIVYAAAQLIDGQHRLEGLKLALKEKPEIAEQNVVVSMAINLKTVDAAKIFLNINSEQKPVPKSLIYDLYGVTEEERNYAAVRAGDIAAFLNENVDSPFYGIIKYPGSPRGKGKLDLSTVINALKRYVDHDGKLEECNISNLVLQENVLQNYFKALKYHADKTSKWSTLSLNIFFKAAGFIGAIEFFMEYVLPKCVAAKSFKEEMIVSLFDFECVELITPKDIETTDGRTARKRVIDNLKEAFISDIPGESDYDI